MAWSVMRGLAVAGLAAGCSSSGGDDGLPTYQDLSDQADALVADGASLDYTEPFTLPGSGSSTYQGVMVIDTDGAGGAPLSMAGEMALIADFDDDAISGSVTNVATDADERLDGSLQIHDGGIDRDADVVTDYTFGFGLDGTLTDPDGTALDVSADGLGDFFGPEHTLVGGFVDGIVATPTGVATAAGGFIGER